MNVLDRKYSKSVSNLKKIANISVKCI